TGKPLKRPARRRVGWFARYRRELVARHGLTDPQALRDAFDLATLYTEWRQASCDVSEAPRLEEAGAKPTASGRTLQKRLAFAHLGYDRARQAFEARWAARQPTLAEAIAESAHANGSRT